MVSNSKSDGINCVIGPRFTIKKALGRTRPVGGDQARTIFRQRIDSQIRARVSGPVLPAGFPAKGTSFAVLVGCENGEGAPRGASQVASLILSFPAFEVVESLYL